MRHLITIDFACKLEMHKSLLHSTADICLWKLRVVDGNVEHGDRRAWWGPHHPQRLQFLDETHGPAAVFSTGEVPVFTVWPERPEIKGSQALDIQSLVPPCCSAPATLPVQLNTSIAVLGFIVCRALDQRAHMPLGINGRDTMGNVQRHRRNAV